MEEFLNEIGIKGDLVRSNNGNYVINLVDSDDYARCYSKLDKSDLVEENEESSQVTLENSSIQYISEDEKYTITLLGDFDGDVYSLTIREN